MGITHALSVVFRKDERRLFPPGAGGILELGEAEEMTRAVGVGLRAG